MQKLTLDKKVELSFFNIEFQNPERFSASEIYEIFNWLEWNLPNHILQGNKEKQIYYPELDLIITFDWEYNFI